MQLSDIKINCADLLILDYRTSAKHALRVVIFLTILVSVISFFTNKPGILLPGIVASVVIAAGYVISRQHASITKIKCPECGGDLSFHNTDRGILLLACRHQKITFKTDCAFRYQGAPPEKSVE